MPTKMSRSPRFVPVVVLAGTLVAAPAWAAEERVPLKRPVTVLPEASLLDVQIVVLDPAEDFLPEVRDAEARYIPVNLKRAFQASGFWGRVRVVPEPGSADLTVSGAVVASHGRKLRLEVRVVDATGKRWVGKTYRDEPDASVYLDRESTVDPFQNLYHRIANDVSKKYRKLKPDDIERIRTVSRLRFASDLAPAAFEPYLRVEKDRYRLERLPARDDPMMEHVARIRQRDGMFVDTVDSYYGSFFEKMREPYRGWRTRDYWQREAMDNEPRRPRRPRTRDAPVGVLVSGTGATGAIGTWSPGGTFCGTPRLFGNASSPDDRERWERERRETHLDILRELGQSLAADVAPLVVEVNGNVSRLTGSVEVQYAKWRVLLKEIFAAETGR